MAGFVVSYYKDKIKGIQRKAAMILFVVIRESFP